MADFCGWSWEVNKEFEMALAIVDEDSSERWKEIASMMGGKKSAEEVKKHYEALLADLDIIESGRLDPGFGERRLGAQLGVWTDDNYKLFKDLNMRDSPKQQIMTDGQIHYSSNL